MNTANARARARETVRGKVAAARRLADASDDIDRTDIEDALHALADALELLTDQLAEIDNETQSGLRRAFEAAAGYEP